MSVRRVLLVAVVAAAIFVPSTAASSGHVGRFRLALVPLQTAQLGPEAASFALNYGSGSTGGGFILVSSGNSPILGGGDSQGEVGGYVLDYGDPYTGSAGVTEIRSSVEAYKTRLDARDALRSGHLLDRLFQPLFLSSPFVHVTAKKVKTAPVGERRFGYLITEAAPNLNPIVSLDEQVMAGKFVLDLTVTAGSASEAERIAPHLLRVLHRRLQLVLEGADLGTPAKLPPDPRTGQAPGGPDLSTLILQPQDVGQSHAVSLDQGYVPAPPALSDFSMDLSPAGTYDDLEQQIGWWPTATEATYAETYGGGSPYGIPFAFLGDFGGNPGGTVTPVDLSSVDDPATGYIVSGRDGSAAYVVLTNGQAGESIVASSKNTIQASDVQSLAQAAANRLDAGLGP